MKDARMPPVSSPPTRARLWLVRVLVALNLTLGFNYLAWRMIDSINWEAWPVALALIGAETYSFIGAVLFGLTMWKWRVRTETPAAPAGLSVDVFITCYNEPAELVRETVKAAVAISYPHRTYVLDDGSSPEMRAMAESEGAGYIVRSQDWHGRERHAKAGNLNNALFQTTGEFILVLDSDQIPSPAILDRTLGYFQDPKVAFVQTPQWFYNVPPGDPFGCQAPLFYGPIQQGKDGWNAAFFCGSNAVLRREALMELGIRYYVRDLERRVQRALKAADQLLRRARPQLEASSGPGAREALRILTEAVNTAKVSLKRGASIQEVTWEFQRQAERASQALVREDLARIRAELADLPGLDQSDLEGSMAGVLDDPDLVTELTGRQTSPLAAIEAVRSLLLAVDVDRSDEAQPVMPMATISVTEDMATAMRMHAAGWRSVYHNEILARGLAPDDFGSALQQRLRWSQGTLQVMLRENPLLKRGLSLGQRLMYFSTMWSYLSGIPSAIYLTVPVVFLIFGVSPVRAYGEDFFWHLAPYLIVNQILLVVVGWGLPTWRGQQYSLALFPLWITALTSSLANVVLGKRLGFVVTPKTQQQTGAQFSLIRPQLLVMGALCVAIGIKVSQLITGATTDMVATLTNIFWAWYDLLLLSVVITAVTYRNDSADERLPAPTMSSEHVMSASPRDG